MGILWRITWYRNFFNSKLVRWELLLYIFVYDDTLKLVSAIFNSFFRPSLCYLNKKTTAINSLEILIVVVLVYDNKRSSFRTWLAGDDDYVSTVVWIWESNWGGKPMNRNNEFQLSFARGQCCAKTKIQKKKMYIKWHAFYIICIGCKLTIQIGSSL